MKVFIHPSVTAHDRQKLENLLVSVDCEIVAELDDIQDENPEDDALCDDPVVLNDSEDQEEQPICIVVLTDGMTEEDLEPELTGAVSRGCRVIGIWAEGGNHDITALDDYGSDTVTWDASHIRDAVCGRPQHQAPDGTPAKKPPTDHGGC